MPVLAIPFIIIGLFAKIANRTISKKQLELTVHTNKEPKFQDLIDIIARDLDNVEKDFYEEFHKEFREKAST